LARISGKDVVGGKLLRQLSGRLKQAEQAYKDVQAKKVYRLGIWLPGSISKRDILLDEPAGSLRLGGERTLEFPQLTIYPSDRLAITGANGIGKSTLLQHLLPRLNVPEEHRTYLPQEIDLSSSQKILETARKLPNQQLGHIMTIISCLGSRPHRLLESTAPSPGEIRKLLLAMGMASLPHIIILDEPTNHMDLPSIECLETALAECPCSLLMVSHDRQFLDRLTTIRWNIKKTKSNYSSYRLRISS